MLTDLIQILDTVSSRANSYPYMPEAVLEIENKIAATIMDELTPHDAVIEAVRQALISFDSHVLLRALALLRIGYPYRQSVIQKIRDMFVKLPSSEVLAQAILDFYLVDPEIIGYIHSSAQAINLEMQGKMKSLST